MGVTRRAIGTLLSREHHMLAAIDAFCYADHPSPVFRTLMIPLQELLQVLVAEREDRSLQRQLSKKTLQPKNLTA